MVNKNVLSHLSHHERVHDTIFIFTCMLLRPKDDDFQTDVVDQFVNRYLYPLVLRVMMLHCRARKQVDYLHSDKDFEDDDGK